MGRINVTFPIFVDSNVQLTMNYRLDDVKHNSVLLPSVHARAYCRSYLGPMPIPSPILTPSPISYLPTFHGDDDRRKICDVLVGMFLCFGVGILDEGCRQAKHWGQMGSTLGKGHAYRSLSTRSCKLTWLVLG